MQGRSGTGKSTLLALLAGWCEPDAGTITWGRAFDGHDVTRWDQVAIVPQVLGLVGELTTRENVELALRGRGTPLAAARGARDPHARCVGAHRGRGPPSARDLTRAETTRGARCALAAEPTLLLADEPTSHQDAATARRVVSVIRARAEAGSGVLVTTHDEMVAAAADRVITLD